MKKYWLIWIWIQCEYICIKKSPGMRNLFIPACMVLENTLGAGKNNKLNFCDSKWPVWDPVFDPRIPPKKLTWVPFFPFFPRKWGTKTFLGPKRGVFRVGAKKFMLKELCAFSVPYAMHSARTRRQKYYRPKCFRDLPFRERDFFWGELISNYSYRTALPEELIAIAETDLWEFQQKIFHYRYRSSLA